MIDIDDVVWIASKLIGSRITRNTAVNIAAPFSYQVPVIYEEIEKLLNTRGKAVFIDKVSCYPIDIENIRPFLEELNMDPATYLPNVLRKYYGKRN